MPYTDVNKLADAVTKHYLDQGKPIAAGFAALCATVIPKNAPPIQIKEMRMAFYAGAQHLFATMMAALDKDTEPTEDDIRRMTLIDTELKEWATEFSKDHFPTKGKG